MHRTKTYYAALGYETPYRWASFASVPFARLTKPIDRCCVGLITTAAPFDPSKGDQGPGAAYNSGAKFYEAYALPTDRDPDLHISHVAYDRQHTTATDQNSYNPVAALRRAHQAGRIGRLAPRFHGAPTNRSQRVTIETDAPAILRNCRDDGVDVAVLVPNCPVCHQTATLVARHLEAGGIPTVILGCAKDIVEQCGAPRFSFSDFPLGNAAGKPHDQASQDATLDLALSLLQSAPAPRTTVQSPQRWAESAEWKLDYSNVERIAPEDLARLRATFARDKEIARKLRTGDRDAA